MSEALSPVNPSRYEFEDKKEYLNALHAQQRDQQASTQFTTNVSKVRAAGR